MNSNGMQELYDLAQANADTYWHAVDLPYRFASWALDDERNGRLWRNADGSLAAGAIRQGAWTELDAVLPPATWANGIADAVIAWGCEREQALANEMARSLTLYMMARTDDEQRHERLRAHGFSPIEWALHHMTQSLDRSIPQFAPPTGFAIRPLQATEVGAYVALHRTAFGSTNMTDEWRSRTRQMPQYINDLDLVAVAPDGQLAAFCIGWLNTARTVVQIEPCGVHPEFGRLGLGRAIVHACLGQMQAHGAATAVVHCETDNPPAFALYTGAGFRSAFTFSAWAKTFHPQQKA